MLHMERQERREGTSQRPHGHHANPWQANSTSLLVHPNKVHVRCHLCLLQVGDTELAVPPPPEPAVEAPQEEEGKEEGALAQAAATKVVESSEVDTTLSVTTTEEEVAVFTMDALSAGIPIQGVEASAAASTNGTGKKVRGPTT